MKHIELITGNSLACCRKFLIIFIIGKLVLAFDFHALDIFFPFLWGHWISICIEFRT
jgi:hypothetical protein